ncbi:MAG: hypothetical protein CSA34_01565 [Desulfobulbus propionicus]|nr:MAG: hypothetical protein CSA34_01565 [Desulfobulbus propionicus]
MGIEPKVDVALLHYPVVNRQGEVICSSVTNLDIHDIARAACTYGIGTYWIVTPHGEQQRLAQDIIDHWVEGLGRRVNPDRRTALARIAIASDLAEVVTKMTGEKDEQPLVVATSARRTELAFAHDALRVQISRGRQILLLLGTAWGLAPDVLSQADMVLEPLQGGGRYNHLSVRSAAAIIMDRLLAS